jgi:hypothetical protein
VTGFEVLYALVCDDVRQEVGGKVSYIGQFDAINVQKLPVMLSKLCMVHAVKGVPGKYRVKTSLISKKTQRIVIEIPEHEIEIKSDSHKVRQVYQLHNVKLEDASEYIVKIEYNGLEFYSYDFVVTNNLKNSVPPDGGPMQMPIKLSQN